MSGERNRFGLFDAMPTNAPADDFRRSVQTHSLAGVAITRLWNGDWLYVVSATATASVTFPAVGDEIGHRHTVKLVSGGPVKITSDSGAVLDGSATHSISEQLECRVYFSDGEQYRQIISPIQPLIGSAGTASFSGAVTMASTLGVTGTLTASAAIAVISGSNDVRMTNDGGMEINRSAGGAYIDMGENAAIDFYVRLLQSGNGLSIRNADGNTTVFSGYATNTSGFTSHIIQALANQVAGSGFHFFSGVSDVDGTPDTEFRVRGDGELFADGAAYNTPADYGEYRETHDGQDIPVGSTVVLVGDKVRAANAGDDPADVIGVVRPKSGEATLACNAANLRWTGRYLKDPYGAYIRGKDGERIQSPDFKPVIVDVTTRDAKGKETTQKLVQYIPRSERQEWVLVGMLGAVAINKGQLMGDRWRKMRDITPEVEEWHIR